MPYTSRSAAAKARWIGLSSAVAMIRDAEGLSELEAQAQLRAALGDGHLHRRWGDGAPPSRFAVPVSTSDDPPFDGEFWARAEIDWREGMVRDDWGLTEEGYAAGLSRMRPLLVDSIGIRMIWPPKSRADLNANSADPGRPGWWPAENEKLYHWCRPSGPAEKAALQRLKDKRERNPSEKRVCVELYAMWQEAGRTGGSAKSIETGRARAS